MQRITTYQNHNCKRAEEEECPLCRVVLGNPRRAFVKHVSRHMEDIAFMALPRNVDEDSETSSINTNHASVEDNDTSKDGFGDDNGNTVYSERDDTGDALILGSPEAERPYVLRSVSPNDSPPAERSPTPVHMSKLKERRRRLKTPSTQGDAVLIGFMGRLNHPDLASIAGEEPLSRESDESADEDEVGSEPGPDALRPLFATASHSKSDTSPREHQAGEEPLSNTLHNFQPSQNSASPGHKRTYQACIPCRRRKVRCDLGPIDAPQDPPCARCRRESKECYFSATRRKRKAEDDESDMGEDEHTKAPIIDR